MRAEALQLSNLRKKRTKSAQTDVRFSHQEAETQVEVMLACQAWNVVVFFVVLACHWPVLDGFD